MFAVHICCALFKRLVTTNEGVVFRFFPLILCLIVLQPFINAVRGCVEFVTYGAVAISCHLIFQ